MSVITLFLDDGGVLNDNERRAPQWRRLVGEFFPARLGGTAAAWAEANRETFPPLFAQWSSRLDDRPGFRDQYSAYQLEWLRRMADHAGVAIDPQVDALGLALEATGFITARVRSAIAGAAEAVRALHGAGFAIHSASGTVSTELQGILSGMHIRECFGQLYGPDLVDIAKAGPGYYRAIFEAANVEPPDALVFDDSPEACAWAEDVGARSLLVDGEMNLAAHVKRITSRQGLGAED